MTINKMDAAEIAKFVADGFRTRVAHLRENLTSEEYSLVERTVLDILSSKIDNKNVQHKTIDPLSGEVTDHASK
jgi:hypothetical protein